MQDRVTVLAIQVFNHFGTFFSLLKRKLPLLRSLREADALAESGASVKWVVQNLGTWAKG